MNEVDYRNLPVPPEEISAANTVCRLIDGLAFRFYWVTENLDPDIYRYKPCEDCRSISQLLSHIWDLLNWVHTDLKGAGVGKPADDEGFRAGILDLCERLKKEFLNLKNENLAQLRFMGSPFWILLNGAIADALTHVGQIGTVRRIAGSPAPESDPFQGTPPKEKK